MAILALLLGAMLSISMADHEVFEDIIDNTDVIEMDAFAGSPLTTDYGDSTYTEILWPMKNVSLPNNLTSFTLCHSYYTWRMEYGEIDIQDANGTYWLMLQVWYLNPTPSSRENRLTREIWYNTFGSWTKLAAVEFQMPSWDYLCHRVDLLNGVVDVHLNGAPLVQSSPIEGLKQNRTRINELLSFMTLTMLKMDIATKLDIFTSNLTSFDCMTNQEGNLMSWSADNMTIDSMSKRGKMLKSDICTNKDPYQLFVIEFAEFYDAVETCDKMGKGVMPSLETDEERQAFNALVEESHVRFNDTFLVYWVPYTRVPGVGDVYANYYTDQPGGNIPWANNYPMNHECAMCGTNGCYTEECIKRFAYVCLFDTPPLLVLQGLCPESVLDHLYHPSNRNKSIHWIGTHRTFIKFNGETNRWEARSLGTSVWAESRASKKSLMLGTSLWTVHNDYNCFSGSSVDVKLSLNACLQDEFNCNDGVCIAMDARCDGKSDCPDESDELSCMVLGSLENYNKEIPAANNGPLGEKGTVNFTINILNVLGILETEAKIKIKLRISMEWLDSRLEFFNLRLINLLNGAEFASIWKPSIRYINKEENLMTNEVNREAVIYVLRNASYDYYFTTFSELHRERIFAGDANMLRWTTAISSNFLCEFNVDRYPFDVQVCVVMLTLEERQLLALRPLPNKITLDGVKDIDQQSILKVQMCNLEVEDEETIFIELTIDRKLMGFFLTICLPTILVNLVGHLTNYFQSDEFDIAIGVNLTSMLVITTMFVSITDSLPKTQSIKMVDVWMLFSLFLPTLDVFLQTYLHEILYGKDPVKDILGDPEIKWAYSSRINSKLAKIQKILPMEKVPNFRWKIDESSGTGWSKGQKYLIARKTLTIGKPILAILFYIGFWIVGMFLLDRDQNKIVGSENYYNCKSI